MPLNDELYRRLLYSAAERRIPAFVMCNLTRRCPLGCRHCYVDAPLPDEQELSLAEYDDFFGQLAAAGTLFLAFSGGEVLVRPDFLDILAAARRRQFAVRIFTSAWGLDARLAEEIAKLQPAAVEISLHAETPGLHDDFVGRAGAWESAVRAAEHLRALGVHVLIKFNAMNFNCQELEAVFARAAGLGAEFRQSPFLFVAADGGRRPLQLRMTDDQLRAYYGRLKARSAPDEPDLGVCDDDLAARAHANHYALSCMASFNSCSVDPYGTVWPCVSLPIDVGNIRRTSFAEIWNGAAMNGVRAYADVLVGACAECEYDAYCSRCAALAVVEEGDITKPTREHCRVARIAREVLGPPPGRR